MIALVVDDNDQIANLLAEILQAEGYDTRVAYRAEPALDAISAGEHLDLLICDVVLPCMTGFELADLIRARHPEAETLFMTGYVDGRVAGYDPALLSRMLFKPFTPTELAAQIRAQLPRLR